MMLTVVAMTTEASGSSCSSSKVIPIPWPIGHSSSSNNDDTLMAAMMAAMMANAGGAGAGAGLGGIGGGIPGGIGPVGR